MNESGLSPNTINRRLAAIKSLIAFGRKMGICTYTIDVDNVTVQPYRDTSGVTEEEFIKVMKGCDLSTLVGKIAPSLHHLDKLSVHPTSIPIGLCTVTLSTYLL